MASLSLLTALNSVTESLNKVECISDMFLLTVNCYGRILLYFRDNTLTKGEISDLMGKLGISDYKISYSELYFCNYVSFRYI